jgi:hypothetical protein
VRGEHILSLLTEVAAAPGVEHDPHA